MTRVDVGHGWGQDLKLNAYPICAVSYGENPNDKECPADYPICVGYVSNRKWGSCHKMPTHPAKSLSKNMKIQPDTAVIDKYCIFIDISIIIYFNNNVIEYVFYSCILYSCILYSYAYIFIFYIVI